jgi:hypothetical protein
MLFSVALEDDLLGVLHAFKHGREYDAHLAEKLLHLYKPPHITNVSQLERLGIEEAPLKSQLAGAGFVSQSIEELAAKTLYKIVLSSRSSRFPYVNIQGDQLGNHYTITCKPGDPRTKALAHLKALLEDAKHVLLCDRHLATNWATCKTLFEFFPRSALSIDFAYPLEQSHKTALKKGCADWKLKQDRSQVYRNLHDRYLLIDRRLEIIITSGIDYLFDNTKECTLIFRPKA